ncbi:ribonuclease P protein component [Aestuariivivens marinum]|uniref:ribonuclease P protein component n=1 Tax=Aestuariivivens marinum TaxID=2913555 RepID=UPI001F561A1A|nr:ribonuclease P protein component [Aestuariivivens marinum]
MRYTFPKREKLKSKKLIEQLFSEGKSVTAFPLRLIYLKTPLNYDVKAQTGVSVSKRHFKRAVDRNRIKRLMREAYRLNKAYYFNNITAQYAFMILYIGKEKPKFIDVDSKTKLLFDKFLDKVSMA